MRFLQTRLVKKTWKLLKQLSSDFSPLFHHNKLWCWLKNQHTGGSLVFLLFHHNKLSCWRNTG